MNWLVKLVLDWLWGKLSRLVEAYIRRKKEEKKIDEDVKKNIDQLKSADTEKEVEDVAKKLADSLSRTP